MILALPAVSYIDSRATLRRGVHVDEQCRLTLARGLYDLIDYKPFKVNYTGIARSPHIAEIVVALG